MFGSKKQPHEVFTPRAAQINESMYVPRPDLEKALENALRGTLNCIVHGDSGTGKSWLYKRVFKDLRVSFEVANLANASRLGSIKEELRNIVDRGGGAHKTGYAESKSAEAGFAPIAKGSIGHTGQYVIGQKEPLEACFEHIRSTAGGGLACIVLDNLESIFSSQQLMKELADIIVLLDDERYSQHKVKIVIVGVPSGVKEYFAKTPNMSTVANRLYEIPEVSRLTANQAAELIRRGFEQQLRYDVRDDMDKIIDHVKWVTDMVPQRIHEYCLELALIGETERKLSCEMLNDADKAWLRSSLSADYATVEAFLNARETKVGRRNQCLYVLGQLRQDEFKASDVEAELRREFPKSTAGIVNLNTNQIIGELAKGDSPIIRRSPKGDTYILTDPKYRMCIRAMLFKEDETIMKRDLRGLLS